MDTVINRLSDIEKAAVSVMDGAGERKSRWPVKWKRKRRRLMPGWKRNPGSHFPDTRKNGRGITAGVKTAERGCQSSDGAAGRGL